MRREIVEKEKNQKSNTSTVFKVGAISTAFLIIGYQAALFINRAAVLRIAAVRDRPDTVYVVDEELASRLLGGSAISGYADADGYGRDGRSGEDAWQAVARQTYERQADTLPEKTYGNPSGAIPHGNGIIIRRDAAHSDAVQHVRNVTRQVESFRFNPNTASVEDLIRLGFSEKQALSIDSYRQKGGRFRRKGDFARSYVVADSVFRRLEPFIDIPKIDINLADSAAFDDLPGIGGYFASKMVAYRDELGGYSCTEQLMDIWNFDRQKYDGLKDLVTCSTPGIPFRLWSLPLEELRKHPYIKSYQTARAIILYRENNPTERLTVEGLAEAGILTEDAAEKLSRCVIEKP